MRSRTKFCFLFLSSIILANSCVPGKITYGPDVYKADSTFKVVGYLGGGNFEQIDSLELNKLTYLNLAFGNPDKDGNLIFDGNYDITSVVKKGHDAGLKVFLSLGGGGTPDTAIWKSVLLPENASEFIAKLMDYVERNKLDGIDVDIEGNLLPTILETYNPFVVELRQALHAKGKASPRRWGVQPYTNPSTRTPLTLMILSMSWFMTRPEYGSRMLLGPIHRIHSPKKRSSFGLWTKKYPGPE